MYKFTETKWRRAVLLWVAMATSMVAGTGLAAIPNPTVTGPIPSVAPGDPSRNYPFLATNLFKAGSGYVEQEFFVAGTATRYSTSCSVVVCPVASSFAPVTVVSTGHPYKVRLIVRRPSDPAKFNGYVIVEWQNVSGNLELDVQWYRSAEYFIRKGFAYVGVGPQRVGIHATPNGLRAWSPSRYGTLDVTVGGTITDDSLKWSIFSQVGQAIAHPMGVDPLAGLPSRTLIATGDSQSSANIATYLNTVHTLDPIYPGAVLAGPLGIPIRPEVTTKVLKVPGEWDVITFESAIRQPDTHNLISWEVAGMAHSPLSHVRGECGGALPRRGHHRAAPGDRELHRPGSSPRALELHLQRRVRPDGALAERRAAAFDAEPAHPRGAEHVARHAGARRVRNRDGRHSPARRQRTRGNEYRMERGRQATDDQWDVPASGDVHPVRRVTPALAVREPR